MTGDHRQECSQRDVAVGWALHALEPEEEAGFARHLPRCGDCADRVRATEAMAAVLAGGVEQLDPPPRLRAAILAAAGTPQSPRVPAAPVRAIEVVPAPAAVRSFSRTRRVLVAAAAVGALAFGAGWVGSSLTTGGASGTTQSALSNPVRTTLTTEGTDQVLAVVVAGQGSTQVVPVNMPAAEDGEAYWLWGVGTAGPVPLGKVVVGSGALAEFDAQGTAKASDYSRYAVSVESDKGVPTVPSTIRASSGTI